ncbi:MAG: protein-L-isoaspartate(D-aspartate) O-methyltransferase [Pseudomonadota bacterium]
MTTRGPSKFPLRLDQMAPAVKKKPGATGGPGAARSGDAPKPVAQPSGMGMDSADVRLKMVARLKAGGLNDERVLAALSNIPRHLFVDGGLVAQAYEDTSLPIGHGQTISKPSVVARMLELLHGGQTARKRGNLGRVLEIGTGCGYQVALLSVLAQSVISVERLKPLYDKARELLAPVRSNNVRLVYADGMLGHPPNAPYDSIIAAAGGEDLPEPWLAQLAPGGRLVAPLVDKNAPAGPRQVLVVVDRTEHGLQRSFHETVLFVPLKSGTL